MTTKTKVGLPSLLAAILILIISLIVPDSELQHKANQTAAVCRVIDGDTIELCGGERVRYIGIDTPERDECYFQEAKEANEKLVLNKKVKLTKDVSETDRYGRLLRYVYVGDLMVNRYLVRQGYAYASTYPPDVLYSQNLIKMQHQASLEKKGFWGEKCYPK
ncbi:hypothetical protein A2459_00335 [Candidatus Roizmanbacteria bacterium RIFOXYC2_FULL_41_10]|nr:MAG: hypothetical protein A2459_00335 [Candidatus Roizmanbacteria bacterium RIFOXYC2_FULL_41_10]